MENLEMKEIESAIEGILFASGEPIREERIAAALELDRPTVQQILQKLRFSGAHGQLAHLIEINRFGAMDDVAVIMQQEKKRMYGIISGDEGWNHIPEALAETRIQSAWSSRDFVEFITFGSNFLLLNLLHSPAAQQYRENQLRFGSSYYGGATGSGCT